MLRKNLSVKRIVSFFISIAIVFCLSSCKVQDVSSGSDNCVTFVDALGRNVSVPKNPERTAALLGSFAEIWQLAGGEVAATGDDAWQDFNLEMSSAVNIGGAHSPSLELLLSANPDFVIASASTASNVDLLESLQNAGITVAYFDVDNFNDYLYMLDICTDITGNKDLYSKNGTDIKAKIDSIKEEFNNAHLSQQQKTVLLLRASSGAVKAKGSSGTVLGEMLSDMGCINIADNNSNLLENLSIESIIKGQPYHIFVVTMGDDKKAITSLTKVMEENPAWSTLEAVKENRLHFMDKKMFNLKPNVRWAQSYEKLCELLCEK